MVRLVELDARESKVVQGPERSSSLSIFVSASGCFRRRLVSFPFSCLFFVDDIFRSTQRDYYRLVQVATVIAALQRRVSSPDLCYFFLDAVGCLSLVPPSIVFPFPHSFVRLLLLHELALEHHFLKGGRPQVHDHFQRAQKRIEPRTRRPAIVAHPIEKVFAPILGHHVQKALGVAASLVVGSKILVQVLHKGHGGGVYRVETALEDQPVKVVQITNVVAQPKHGLLPVLVVVPVELREELRRRYVRRRAGCRRCRIGGLRGRQG
mmetsp:Transcript_16668/g.38257  ORF Transcript_16668/g.38257 Transcript_16668/m.38257 type:complete len:265 (+) Transcript_16668:158-952(+)